jgi:hypothetical protein
MTYIILLMEHPIQLKGFLIILSYPEAILVLQAEIVFGKRIVLGRRLAIPVNRLDRIFLNSLP